MSDNKKKLTLIPLILIIFTSVFGFTNMPRGFLLMGYSAIPWYIGGAILFFIPYAFMMSEYGAAFREEKGGMFSWMEKSVSTKFAFVGTFMWYASYVIWMVNVGSGIWVPLSNAIFGADTTGTWSLFGLTSVQTLGILAILWVVGVTILASKGIEKISKVTSIGGTAVALLNIVLLVGAIIVFITNGGELAQPIENIGAALTKSPNSSYQSITGIFSFLTFAIFAYGGLEAVGALVDETENAEKTFPKGVLIAAIIISVGYAIGIFACGVFTNWNEILNNENVHLGNVAYIVLKHLGYQIGLGVGMGEASALVLGAWVARFVGLSMFLALTGAYFTLIYSPLKTLIQGTPKELWPGRLGEIEDGMPKFAMKVQAIIVAVILLIVSFGGDSAAAFFNLLALMTNVAMTIPYMFLTVAFISFKKKQLSGQIQTPFVIYKTQGIATLFAAITTFVIGFANVFTIIQPAIESSKGITDTISMIAGPVIFIVAAYLLFNSYEKKHKKNAEVNKDIV